MGCVGVPGGAEGGEAPAAGLLHGSLPPLTTPQLLIAITSKTFSLSLVGGDCYKCQKRAAAMIDENVSVFAILRVPKMALRVPESKF